MQLHDFSCACRIPDNDLRCWSEINPVCSWKVGKGREGKGRGGH